MQRVLIVEDSKMFAVMISRKIRFELEFERDIATTLKETRKLIAEKRTNILLPSLTYIYRMPHAVKLSITFRLPVSL